MKNFEQEAFAACMVDPNSGAHHLQTGLTKLEYASIQAMKALLSDPTAPDIGWVLHFLELPKDTKYDFKTHYPLYISKLSINYAKTLLTELQNTEK